MSAAKNAARTWAEGDRCSTCGHWWWKDGQWHSLMPKLVADVGESRTVTCPHCAALSAALPGTDGC